MKLRFSVLAILLLSTIACRRQQSQSDKAAKDNDVIRGADLSGVYRADKELQAALSSPIAKRENLPELEKLTLTLKTQLSILQDRISYDQRLQGLSPLVVKYSQIVSGYQAYEEMQALIEKHIDCVMKVGADSDICDRRFTPQENEVRRKLSSVGIACDPSHGFARGGKCDFTAQIAPVEAEATRIYMQLIHAGTDETKRSKL